MYAAGPVTYHKAFLRVIPLSPKYFSSQPFVQVGPTHSSEFSKLPASCQGSKIYQLVYNIMARCA